MISTAYIGRQFSAIIAMLRNREEWRVLLDMSGDGVFRSFWAIPLSLPLVVISNIQAERLLKTSPNYALLELPELPVTYTAILQCIVFIAAWAIALLLLVGFAQRHRAGNRVTPLIVSYNWSILFLHLINCASLVVLGLIGSIDLLLVVSLALRAFWFYMRWCLIRQTLESDILATLGIIILIFIATLLLGSILNDLGIALYERLIAPPTPVIAGESIEIAVP